MNWLTNKVLPKIRALGRKEKKDIPDRLWEKCPSCAQMIFARDLDAAQRVCPQCGYHMRLSPESRFRHLFDQGEYTLIDVPETAADPLKFRDSKRYTERLRDARAKSAASDAIQVAQGKLDSVPVVIAVQNFAFMGGSMGLAVGEALLTAARTALRAHAPLIVFTASGGARMQEGILSLMQMPRTVIAVRHLRSVGLPFLVVLTDPTTGGVTASYGMLGDIQIAEPGALIGFAGPRVIEQTIREKLPEGFQRAEYLFEHGMLDLVVHRHELRATLARLVSLLRRPAADRQALPRPA